MISASTDGTARLWSPTRPDCLAVFPHTDIVTCVAFHPSDDRRFITGSYDCRIRLWNIEERRVVAWNELPAENVVTAVGWSAGGRYALAGSSTGVLLFFETEV
jgi:WD40 repeat protein